MKDCSIWQNWVSLKLFHLLTWGHLVLFDLLCSVHLLVLASCLHLMWNSGGMFLRVLLCFIHQLRLLKITPDISHVFSSGCRRVPLLLCFVCIELAPWWLLSSARPTLSLNKAGAAPDWICWARCDIDRAVNRITHSSVRSCLPEELPFDYSWFFNDTVSRKLIFHVTPVTPLHCWTRRHVEFLPPIIYAVHILPLLIRPGCVFSWKVCTQKLIQIRDPNISCPNQYHFKNSEIIK